MVTGPGAARKIFLITNNIKQEFSEFIGFSVIFNYSFTYFKNHCHACGIKASLT